MNPKQSDSTSQKLASLRLSRMASSKPLKEQSPATNPYRFLLPAIVIVGCIAYVGTTETRSSSVSAEVPAPREDLHPPASPTTTTSFSPEIESVLDATGYVVARQAATVSAKSTGRIAQVLIEEGMLVAKGQIIATLENSTKLAQYDLALAQLAARESMIEEVRIQLDYAQAQHARGLSLARSKLLSSAELDKLDVAVASLQARVARTNQDIEVSAKTAKVRKLELEELIIRAPFTGVVTNKAAQPGEMISPVSAGGGFTRTGIGTIVDMQSLEVEVDVNESYINRVQPRQTVSIQLNAYPNHAYEGHVLAVIPAADRHKATIRVRIAFVAIDQKILPEMGVRVKFHTA